MVRGRGSSWLRRRRDGGVPDVDGGVVAARRRQQGIRVRWGRTGHVPVAADFDGDGRADVAVWRPSTGQWWLRWLLRGSREVTWGQPGDVAVPADYDGNAAVDVAVWRPSTGRWLRRGSPDG